MLQQPNPVDIVSKARKAFNKNTTKSPHHRKNSLKNLIKFFQENENAIIESIFVDSRKDREETRWEILTAVFHIQYLIVNLDKWASADKVPKRWVDVLDGVYVCSDPYGVVLVMTCWNMPILTLLPISGAIAAGNCVVVKPSHNGPRFGSFIATTLPKYLDSACYPVMFGSSEDTAKLLQERFDYIYFTGSPTVGKIVHRAANKYLTPTTLQLGGKNPVYIDSSADLKIAAARIIWGKCVNSGQACSCPDYILCTKSVERDFIKHAKMAITRFFPNSGQCPIVNNDHLQRLKRLLKNLEIAVGGGFDPSENTMEPTIAINVSPDHPIMQEEIFGPILPIVTVDNVEEAVEFINGREKPLVIYIFTKDTCVKDFFVGNTSSGALTVNDTMMHVIVESLPFGGVGSSGMGRFKGKYSFDTFVNKKSVLDKNTWGILEKLNEIRYPPLSRRKTDTTKFLLKYRKAPLRVSLKDLRIFLLGFVAGFVIFYFVFVLQPRLT